MRVLIFPFSKANPYQELLADGLASVGVEVSFDKSLFGFKRPVFDLLHLHWLPTDLTRRVFLLFRLLVLRVRKIPVVWTTHNLFSHGGGGLVELWYKRIISRISAKLICHCQQAKTLVVQTYGVGADKVMVIPHGSYMGVYPANDGKFEFKKKLGIKKDTFVFLHFGMINDYKGIPQLIEDFRRVKKTATLVIAGKVSKPLLEEQLRDLSVKDERIKLVLEFIPDEDVSGYFGAADCMVLPYKNILTSGTAALAASFGKPVIAPRVGCIREQLGQGDTLLYDPGEKDGLFNALKLAFTEDLEALGKRNLEKSRMLSWSNIAKETVKVYKEAVR